MLSVLVEEFKVTALRLYKNYQITLMESVSVTLNVKCVLVSFVFE